VALAVLVAAPAGRPLLASLHQAQEPRPDASARRVTIDVTVAASDGRVPPDLGASDFEVSVDRKPRRVLSARFVPRGPGAAVLLSRQLALSADAAAALTRRVVILVVDQASLARGAERSAVDAVKRLIDRLGPSDEVAIVRLPLGEKGTTLVSERPAVLAELKRVAGRALPPGDERADEAPPIDDQPPTEEGFRRTVTMEQRLRPATEPVLGAAAHEEQMRSAATLGALRGLFDGLTKIAGRKTAVLVSSGVVADIARLSEVARAAAAARAAVYAFRVPAAPWQRFGSAADMRTLRDEIEKPDVGQGFGGQRELNVATDQVGLTVLTSLTGGTVLPIERKMDPAIEAFVTTLSGDYLLAVESDDSDWDSKPHQVSVTVRKAGFTAWTHRFLAPRDEPADRELTIPAEGEPVAPGAPPPRPAAAATPAPPTTEPRPAASAEGRKAAVDPVLDLLIARASEYVASYERDFSAVVAEERYRQVVRIRGNYRNEQSRRLRSDFLLVKSPGVAGWVPFRDVLEVDGTAVRDRDDRLRKLFLEAPATAFFEARKITDESARYNIGSIERNVNVPTLPLLFLKPENLARFRLKRRGEENVEGIRAAVVDYSETGRPTIVRGYSNGDMPAEGVFWIDLLTGRVVRTSIRISGATLTMETTVQYRPNDVLGLWAPAEMREQYKSGSDVLDAVATYTNFRRFQVFTEEQIKIPK
jgi:VWFA-related protein